MRGFLVLAQNTETVNYVEQAYALALSLHASQSDCHVSIVTNDPVPTDYQKAFDKIIPIPGIDDAADSTWKVENRWKLFHVTPYEETIVFDSDMLVFRSFDHMWDQLANYDIFFASHVIDFKGNVITDHLHRRTFNENELPNLYFGLHYFKKTQPALDFYNTMAFVIANWERMYFDIAPKSKQKWVSLDVSAAIAAKILGVEDQVIHPTLNFNFAHMKPGLQQIDPIPSTWNSVLDYYFNEDGKLIVSNILQDCVFHYVNKAFLTKAVIKELEGIANV